MKSTNTVGFGGWYYYIYLIMNVNPVQSATARTKKQSFYRTVWYYKIIVTYSITLWRLTSHRCENDGKIGKEEAHEGGRGCHEKHRTNQKIEESRYSVVHCKNNRNN